MKEKLKELLDDDFNNVYYYKIDDSKYINIQGYVFKVEITEPEYMEYKQQ